MRLKVNPFRPDKPLTDFDLFAGRANELSALVDSLFQAAHGNPRHLLVSGLRGIGKSSFINQIKSISENPKAVLDQLKIDASGCNFKFAVFKHRAASGENLDSIVGSLVIQMFDYIQEEGIRKHLSDFLKRVTVKGGVGLLSVEVQPGKSSEASSDFAKVARQVWSDIKATHDGMVFIIDEIETVAESSGIATFLKLVTEELDELGIKNACWCLVGAEGVMDDLKKDHESIERIFKPIELLHLSRDESREIIKRTLDSEPTAKSVRFSEQAFERILEISEGFPGPIHSLCYEAFKNDNDDCLGEDDIEYAINELVIRIRRVDLGKIYGQVGRGNYRKILKALAQHEDTEVYSGDIAKQLGRTSNQISSYMTKLVNDGLLKRTDLPAYYTFVDPVLRQYVKKLHILEPQLPFEFAEEDD